MTQMTAKASNLAEMARLGLSVPIFYYWDENRDDVSSFISEHPNLTWIVRSSFSVEDNTESAFAGCFRSQVVYEPAQITEAIKYVRAAIADEQTRQLILAAGVDPSECNLGVIVQQFITGQVSGVAFSKNPQDGSSGFTEWALGGCAALTSGEAVPEKASFEENAPLALKVFWRQLRLGVQRLEKHFKSPVDVEWAFDGRKLWWLQVRPMTGEAALRLMKSKGGARWSRDKIAERFPDVMTPMGWSLIEETLEHSMHSLVEFTGLRCHNVERASLFEKGYAYGNEKYFRYPNCAFSFSAGLKIVGRALIGLAKSGMPARRTWASRLTHHAFLKTASQHVLCKWHEELDAHLEKIRNFDPHVKKLSTAQAKIEELRALSFGFFKTDLAIHFLKEVNVHLVAKALDIAPNEITHFAHNETLMMHHSLRELCEALREETPTFLEALKAGSPDATKYLSERAKAAFDAFMDHCGHMSEGWDVTSKALRENNAAISALIESAVKREGKIVFKGAPAATVASSDLQKMHENARALCAADEQQHFYAGLYLERSRQVLASIASLLIDKEVIESTCDIYYLSASELERYLAKPGSTLIPFVQRRKRMWNRYKNKETTALRQSGEKLRGLGVSCGVATGRPYFADSFEELKNMPEHSVLCMKTPNPSFVPWFDLCNGIITENGGILSHGFIAARELQIPAVSGIFINDLKEMEHVIVDGNAGCVTKGDLRRDARPIC